MLKPLHLKGEPIPSNIYVDLENIYELLRLYQTSPLEINFFPVILERLKKTCNLSIIDCIAYCNFEKKCFNGNTQTVLQKLGIQTRHSANGTKNCGDLLLTVDALIALNRYPNINAFVIISSDRDMIPLLNAIKASGKYTILISTRQGFNSVVAGHADYHEYIEDIFGLEMPPEKVEPVYESDGARAKEVSGLLYSSKVWLRHELTGEPVTLKGYALIVSKAVNRPPSHVIQDFQAADFFGYVKLYEEPQKGLCLKKGGNYTKAIQKEPGK